MHNSKQREYAALQPFHLNKYMALHAIYIYHGSSVYFMKNVLSITLIMGFLYLIQVDTQLHLILVSHFT